MRNAAANTRRLELLLEMLAHCPHDRANRLLLTWCDVCGAMRNRSIDPWTIPITRVRARVLVGNRPPPKKEAARP